MKKLLILVFALLLCLMATSAFAEVTTYSGILDKGIVIDTPGEHTIILNGLGIHETITSPLYVKNPATKLTIILKDGSENYFSSPHLGESDFSVGHAGIRLDDNVALIIRCEHTDENHVCDHNCGKLRIGGSSYGAGIGSNTNDNFTGTVTIAGGSIHVSTGLHGAAIGSGMNGDFLGNVNISGGIVEIGSDYGGLGIGSGWAGDFLGNVTISDGTVTIISYDGVGIGACGEGNMNGNVIIEGGTIDIFGGWYSPGIGSSRAIFTNIMSGDMSGKVLVKGGNVIIRGGVGFEQAIGAGFGGNETEDMEIYVAPNVGVIEVKQGQTEEDVIPVEGSPFASKTDLIPLLNSSRYLQFIHNTPTPIPSTPTPAPATSIPATPTPAPEIPATGDNTSFAFLVLLAAAGMLGMTIILRRKNEA